jgi:hypothetical protein
VDWKHNPVTKEVFKALRERGERYKEEMILGYFSHEGMEATVMKHAEIIGRYSELDAIQNLSFDEVSSE